MVNMMNNKLDARGTGSAPMCVSFLNFVLKPFRKGPFIFYGVKGGAILIGRVERTSSHNRKNLFGFLGSNSPLVQNAHVTVPALLGTILTTPISYAVWGSLHGIFTVIARLVNNLFPYLLGNGPTILRGTTERAVDLAFTTFELLRTEWARFHTRYYANYIINFNI